MKFISTLAAALTLMLFTSSLLADKTAGDVVDDSAIQAELKTKLIGDNPIDGLSINIEVRKGVVQLGGFIDDAQVGEDAARTAAGVEGVVEVDNQLHLKEGKASMGRNVDDKVVTTKVKGSLGEIGSGSSLFKVNVDTYNGVVLLTGFVDSDEIKDKAGDIAKGTDNVNKVINGIHVLD
jgi:hyperosmotically inducible protein